MLDPDEARAPFSDAGAFHTIDWSAIVEALPEDVERLAHNVTACDAPALDARLGAARRALRRIDWQLGRLLRLFVDCRLYELFGFDSWSRYLRERLGLEARKARVLVALERRTWQSPALMEACRSGTLSALRALTIAPVLGGAAAEAWVQRATEVTMRRLADEVCWALDVRDAGASCVSIAPPAHGAALDPPPRQMRAPVDETLSAEIGVRGPASVIALFRTAVAAFHPSLAPAWTGLVNLLAYVWELGVRRGGPPLLRLVGDRYEEVQGGHLSAA